MSVQVIRFSKVEGKVNAVVVNFDSPNGMQGVRYDTDSTAQDPKVRYEGSWCHVLNAQGVKLASFCNPKVVQYLYNVDPMPTPEELEKTALQPVQ